MKNFLLKIVLFGFLLLFITPFVYGQNELKIERKLESVFSKQKYDQVQKKALNYQKKNPKSEVCSYYLSRVEIVDFNKFELPNKKQWTHLRKATIYAKGLSPKYSFWHDSLNNYYTLYIESWDDENYNSSHLKKVVKFYSTQFKDTLGFYSNYFQKQGATPINSDIELPYTDSLRTELLTFASQWVGTPYKYGGESPESGFDCSGFVKYVYQNIDIELPHNAQMQSQLEGLIIPLDEAEPGDLIFFGTRDGKNWRTQHAGIIYEYNDDEPKVIHCVSRGVSIDGNNTSWDSYWKQRILFVKRLPQFE